MEPPPGILPSAWVKLTSHGRKATARRARLVEAMRALFACECDLNPCPHLTRGQRQTIDAYYRSWGIPTVPEPAWTQAIRRQRRRRERDRRLAEDLWPTS